MALQAAVLGLIFIGNYVFFRIRLGIGQMVGYAITLTGVLITAANGSTTVLVPGYAVPLAASFA